MMIDREVTLYSTSCVVRSCWGRVQNYLLDKYCISAKETKITQTHINIKLFHIIADITTSMGEPLFRSIFYIFYYKLSYHVCT